MATPTVVRRAVNVSATSNSTTWGLNTGITWNLNTVINSGERVLWVLIVTSDGSSTLTESGSSIWTKQDQATDGASAVTQAIFTTETTSAFAGSAWPGFVLASSASEQFSCIVLAFKMGTNTTVGFLLATAATGSSTNSNPPSVTNSSGASRDTITVCTRGGDSTVVASAAPTNYGNLQTRAGGGTNGASTNTAERAITVASAGSEDPGTFTSATEQWVSYTFLVYEVPATFSYPPINPSLGVMLPLLSR